MVDYFYQLKLRMREPIDSMNLPTLEPYKIDSINLHANTIPLKLNLTITNIVGQGFSGFVIDQIQFNPENLTAFIEIRIPQSYVTANYNLNGTLFGYKLPAKGSFRTVLSKIINFFLFNNYFKSFNKNILF